MKKIMLGIGMMVFMMTLASAWTLERQGPSYVNPGENFTVTYKIQSPQGQLFVAYADDIKGGCSPLEVQSSMISPTVSSQIAVFTAPNNISNCTFEGYYYFQDGITKNFPRMFLPVGVQPVPQINITEPFTIQPIPENLTANQTFQTPSRLSSFVEKFAFFNVLQNKKLEGAIVLILGGIVLFYIWKAIK